MTFYDKKYLEICKFLEDSANKKNGNINTKIIVVTKNRSIEDICKALNTGIRHFGEIRIQETFNKFINLKTDYKDLVLHMLGTLQTNKVKKSLEIFDFFHSLDRESLANEFSKYKKYLSSKSFFIQVNTGLEAQKSGINPSLVSDFVSHCIHDLSLNVVGLMCLPPVNDDPKKHFLMLNELALKNNLKQLSMGMSNDYKTAIECGTTFIRIGSKLFG